MTEWIAIRQLLLISVLTTFSLVAVGGGIYLLKYGADLVNYSSFHAEPIVYKTTINIFTNSLTTLSALSLIQLGLLLLVIAQVLRVGMIAWQFMWSKEIIFTIISLFILFLMVYSLFFHV